MREQNKNQKKKTKDKREKRKQNCLDSAKAISEIDSQLNELKNCKFFDQGEERERERERVKETKKQVSRQQRDKDEEMGSNNGNRFWVVDERTIPTTGNWKRGELIVVDKTNLDVRQRNSYNRFPCKRDGGSGCKGYLKQKQPLNQKP